MTFKKKEVSKLNNKLKKSYFKEGNLQKKTT